MKIEMAEQAIASYLKNCEICTNVQTNWKMPPIVLDEIKLNAVEQVIKEISCSTSPVNLFKKSTTKQFLSQAETDVFGMKNELSSPCIYLVDTAFHENGLHYKNNPEVVVKKLVRAAILADSLYPGCSAYVWFVSPKVDPGQVVAIQTLLNKVTPILNSHYANVKVELYLNEECAQMIGRLVGCSAQIHDDNDLFMRAVKLLELAELIQIGNGNKITKTTRNQLKTNSNNKILVLDSFNSLLASGKLTDQVLSDLTDKAYTKRHFGISSFSVFLKATGITSDLKKRYYSYSFIVRGVEYRICSQWGRKSIDMLEIWKNSL